MEEGSQQPRAAPTWGEVMNNARSGHKTGSQHAGDDVAGLLPPLCAGISCWRGAERGVELGRAPPASPRCWKGLGAAGEDPGRELGCSQRPARLCPSLTSPKGAGKGGGDRWVRRGRGAGRNRGHQARRRLQLCFKATPGDLWGWI